MRCGVTPWVGVRRAVGEGGELTEDAAGTNRGYQKKASTSFSLVTLRSPTTGPETPGQGIQP